MTFLEALQDAQAHLREVREHYAAMGATNVQTVFNLSGRPFTVAGGDTHQEYRGSLAIGLLVAGPDGREYDLGVELMWDGEAWTIDTQAWVSHETQNQVLLRELPRRSATELDDCLLGLQEALDSLKAFDALVFAQ